MRKWSEAIDNGANHLIAVPGGGDGPGGCLVCAENFIIYKNEGHADVRAVIPRRSSLSGDRGVLIVSSATHRTKQQFFFLAQSEYGDVYKVTVEWTPGSETVSEVKIKYFDTIPPCASLCVLKTGFLFAASEFSNHALYQFQGIGDDDDDVESSSATLVETERGVPAGVFRAARCSATCTRSTRSSRCARSSTRSATTSRPRRRRRCTRCAALGRGARCGCCGRASR